MWYDVVIAVIILWATIRGAKKGIVWQLAVIASIVLCFSFAEQFSVSIAPLFNVKPPLDRWLAMLTLYIGFSFLSFGAARVLREWIEKAKFEEYDQHLGALFGFIKGIMIALVLTFFVVTLGERLPQLREQVFYSFSGRGAAIIMDRLHPVLPDELHEVLAPYIHSLDRPGLDLQHAHDDYDGHDHADGDGSHVDAPPFGSGNGALPGTGSGPVPLPLSFPDFGNGDPFANSGINSPRSNPNAPEPPRTISPRENIQPVPANGAGPPNTNLKQAVNRMIAEIGSTYSSDPRAQAMIVRDVNGLLEGIPDQVQHAVIEDWYTDLLIFDRSRDPDPATDLTTPLDQRIVRELERTGISWRSLSADVQQRLQQALRR